jgi:hypothetical protein
MTSPIDHSPGSVLGPAFAEQLEIRHTSPYSDLVLRVLFIDERSVDAYYNDLAQMLGTFEYNLTHITEELVASAKPSNGDRLIPFHAEKVLNLVDGRIILSITGHVTTAVDFAFFKEQSGELLEMLDI